MPKATARAPRLSRNALMVATAVGIALGLACVQYAARDPERGAAACGYISRPAASVRLSSGAMMPTLGIGTWLSKKGEVKAAVLHAIAAGYRHIDTAW
jgi:hypothetical protein